MIERWTLAVFSRRAAEKLQTHLCCSRAQQLAVSVSSFSAARLQKATIVRRSIIKIYLSVFYPSFNLAGINKWFNVKKLEVIN